MALTRKFLDWTPRPLEAAVGYLAGRFIERGQFDLSNVTLVLPGRRACRQILKQLAIYSKQNSLVLLAPETYTPGRFPESLYSPRRPIASELEQKFAWAKALRGFRRSGQTFVTPPNEETDVTAWLDLADLFFRTHEEISSCGMEFSDVVNVAQKIPGFNEIQRWRFFQRVQEKYFSILSELGRDDLQRARKQTIDSFQCQTQRDIVLVGLADINPLLIQMLEQVRDRVTSLIHAPDTLSDRFDHFGNLITQHWESSRTNVDDDQIELVDGAEDQAVRLIEILNQLQEDHSAAEISIGIGDPSLVRQFQSEFRKAGVEAHWVGGHSFSESQPYQLLWALAAYIEGQRFYEFAALVRHPIVTNWIDRTLFPQQSGESTPIDWLSQMDRYFQEHLQPKLGNWLGPKQEWNHIRKINEAIESLVAPLIRPRYRKLNEWAAILVQVVIEFFEGVTLDGQNPNDQMLGQALDRVRKILFEVRSIPESLAPSGSAAEALQLILSRLQTERLAVPRHADSIELLGWLELPLDESPVTLMTSMNDQYIPHSKNEDAMLPNSLRSKLGLPDNSRRFARDNYFLNVLRSSRKQLSLIVAKTNREGEPLTPSRLLFASPRKTLPERVLRLFGHGEKLQLDLASGDTLPTDSKIQVPKARRRPEPIRSISVTAFRSYLACPYHFYLKHVEKLETLDDQVNELSPPSFGNAIHDVLEAFGNSELSNSTNARSIRELLDHQLDEYFLRMFGKQTLPAVDIQKEQSRQRLRAFADWQAEWAAEGWTIKHNEVQSKDVFIELDDGRSIELRGRIDRIDYHPDRKVSAIFDYKTGDRETSPNRKHRDSDGNWLDLQLPLYQPIAKSLGVPGPYLFGYIALPKDLSLLGEYFADWSEPDLADAMNQARQVVTNVLDQKFWPPANEHRYRKDFAAICQDHVLDRKLEPDESDASPAPAF